MFVWVTPIIKIPMRAGILTHKKKVPEAGSAQMLPPWWIKTISGLPTSKLSNPPSHSNGGGCQCQQCHLAATVILGSDLHTKTAEQAARQPGHHQAVGSQLFKNDKLSLFTQYQTVALLIASYQSNKGPTLQDLLGGSPQDYTATKFIT